MDSRTIIEFLKSLSNPKNVQGMARYGINPYNTLGVGTPALRQLAKKTGKNHALAGQLWESGIHEARILAAYIEDPKLVTRRQMDLWVNDFDSWDVCDQVCGHLFDKTPFAYAMAKKWSASKKEFVKRAGFSMMACLAVHDKNAENKAFLPFFSLILKASTDERNFVKKSVNWALRQIGKRNTTLHPIAIKTAQKIKALPSKSARWIASDALRELSGKFER